MKIFDSASSVLTEIKEACLNMPSVKYVGASKGAFGDDTVFLAVCFTPKAEWTNNIFENSNYVRFSIQSDGVVESFVSSLYSGIKGEWRRLDVKKFRKCTAKSVADVIKKIAAYVDIVNAAYAAELVPSTACE